MEISPHIITYDIDIQMNELFDDLIFKIPDEKRSIRKMRELHTHVNRFKELRHKYSKFDEYGQVIGYVKHDNPRSFKPLVDDLYNMNVKHSWIVPVASTMRDLYKDEEEENPYNDCTLLSIDAQVNSEYDLMRRLFTENDTPNVENNKYANMYNQMSTQYYTPFFSSY